MRADPAVCGFLKTTGLTMMVMTLPVRTRCRGSGDLVRPVFFRERDWLRSAMFRERVPLGFSKSDTIESAQFLYIFC